MRIAPVMIGDPLVPARPGPGAAWSRRGEVPVASHLRQRLAPCARTRAVRYRH